MFPVLALLSILSTAQAAADHPAAGASEERAVRAGEPPRGVGDVVGGWPLDPRPGSTRGVGVGRGLRVRGREHRRRARGPGGGGPIGGDPRERWAHVGHGAGREGGRVGGRLDLSGRTHPGPRCGAGRGRRAPPASGPRRVASASGAVKISEPHRRGGRRVAARRGGPPTRSGPLHLLRDALRAGDRRPRGPPAGAPRRPLADPQRRRRHEPAWSVWGSGCAPGRWTEPPPAADRPGTARAAPGSTSTRPGSICGGPPRRRGGSPRTVGPSSPQLLARSEGHGG